MRLVGSSTTLPGASLPGQRKIPGTLIPPSHPPIAFPPMWEIRRAHIAGLGWKVFFNSDQPLKTHLSTLCNRIIELFTFLKMLPVKGMPADEEAYLYRCRSNPLAGLLVNSSPRGVHRGLTWSTSKCCWLDRGSPPSLSFSLESEKLVRIE